MCDGFGMMGEWLSLGAPRMQRMSCHRHTMHMHVHVVGMHVHCIKHFGIVLGSGVLVLGIHKGIASCVFLKLEYKDYFCIRSSTYGLFDVQHCCVGLCIGLSCAGWCMWIVGVALC